MWVTINATLHSTHNSLISLWERLVTVDAIRWYFNQMLRLQGSEYRGGRAFPSTNTSMPNNKESVTFWLYVNKQTSVSLCRNILRVVGLSPPCSSLLCCFGKCNSVNKANHRYRKTTVRGSNFQKEVFPCLGSRTTLSTSKGLQVTCIQWHSIW